MKYLLAFAVLITLSFGVTFPLFKQCDSRWMNEPLGTSLNTICSAGCLMSSVSMVLNGYGKQIDGQDSDPHTLNQWLIKNGGYAQKDLFVWASIQSFGFSFIGLVNQDQVLESFEAGNIVILNVHQGKHWVLMTGYNGNDLYVNDPGFQTKDYQLTDVVRAGTYKQPTSHHRWIGWEIYEMIKNKSIQVNASCGSCPDIKSMIAESEGNKPCMYKDTLGHPTIGIGFNLDRSDAREKITSVGADYDNVKSGKQCLSDSQITTLFEGDVASAKKGVAKCITSFGSQPTCAQNVLIDMTFNMGNSSLCLWKNLNTKLSSYDYEGAKESLTGSLWCKQVKSRCTRDSDIIGSCKK